MPILLMRKARLPVFRSLDGGKPACQMENRLEQDWSLGRSDVHISLFSITSFYCPLENSQGTQDLL